MKSGLRVRVRHFATQRLQASATLEGWFQHAHGPELFLAKKLDRLPDYRYAGEPTLNKSVVYFIQEGDDGPIKIGLTTGCSTIAARLSACQVGNPQCLFLRATTPGGRQLELALHERFAEYRMRGEWFAPVDDLLTLVGTLATADR